MINYEIKSQLPNYRPPKTWWLRTETLRRASFDVETRVLTLPMWELASRTVYDMLVGHEVGHYTLHS